MSRALELSTLITKRKKSGLENRETRVPFSHAVTILVLLEVKSTSLDFLPKFTTEV